MSSSRVVVLVALVAACGQAPALRHPTDPATDFYQVSAGIYRGGRLDRAGVDRLAKLGVKTILNLEDDDEAIASERAWASAASITQVSMPLSGQWAPHDRQIDRALAAIADPSKRPIYVHCKKGMDRTGIVIALYRVRDEGWTPTAAERERDALGFNPWLVFLDRYYDRRARALTGGETITPRPAWLRADRR